MHTCLCKSTETKSGISSSHICTLAAQHVRTQHGVSSWQCHTQATSTDSLTRQRPQDQYNTHSNTQLSIIISLMATVSNYDIWQRLLLFTMAYLTILKMLSSSLLSEWRGRLQVQSLHIYPPLKRCTGEHHQTRPYFTIINCRHQICSQRTLQSGKNGIKIDFVLLLLTYLLPNL